MPGLDIHVGCGRYPCFHRELNNSCPSLMACTASVIRALKPKRGMLTPDLLVKPNPDPGGSKVLRRETALAGAAVAVSHRGGIC